MTVQILKTYIFLLSCHFISGNVIHPPIEVFDSSSNDLQRVEYFLRDYEDNSLVNCSTYTAVQQYVLMENGSLLLPISKSIHHSYFLRNDTAYLCSDDVPETVTEPVHNFSDEFILCGHVRIDPDEYKLLPNRSIYIGMYLKMYGPRDYFLKDHFVYICVPSYEDLKRNLSIPDESYKFTKGTDYVTFAGLLISIVCLLSHLVGFSLVSSVRNLPGCCLASLSLSLLLAYLCFIIAYLLRTNEFCAELGMCIYYFFLTSFFWMNTIAFDVWRSFRVVMRKLRISSQKIPLKRFFLYSMYSWVIPALLTILVKLFDSTDILPEDFRPSFGHNYCWFGQRKALLVFFAVPLIAIILLNIAFFADVIYVINMATLKTGHSHDANLKKSFVMFTRLALIMGLTWIFGIAAGFVDNIILWYIFIILNTLQGLFIFAVFMASSKIRNLCFKKHQNQGKRYSASVRTITSAL